MLKVRSVINSLQKNMGENIVNSEKRCNLRTILEITQT